MNNYEIMFIVKPTLDEAAVKKTFDEMKKVLKDNKAKITNEEEMGQRELAYEIKKHKSGYYFLINAEASAEAISEFVRKSTISDNVIRHLVTKLEK